ncbi:MAG: hypothetical protein HY920_07295 [Elusimicrobia bacterium]|nr:hypothetical protein [Elusimicrobiota bacterium]
MEKQKIQEGFQRIAQHLNDKTRRLWCANEALAIGFGGILFVAKATGISRTTIAAGVKEIEGKKELPHPGLRRKGGGRKLKIRKDQKLEADVKKKKKGGGLE